MSIEEQVKSGILRSTTLTRVFTGKPARGIRNKMIDAFHDHENDLLPWRIQDRYIQPYANYAKKVNEAEYQQMWAGQNYVLCESKGTADVMMDIVNDAADVLKRNVSM